MLTFFLYEKVIKLLNVPFLERNLFCHLSPWDSSSKLNLVIECEVCLTFNGNNLHEYIPGHTHPCSFSFCVKGEYH